MVIFEDTPEFLMYSRHTRDDSVILSVLFLTTSSVDVVPGPCSCFHKGPVSVSTGFQGILQVLVFLLSGLCTCRTIISLVLSEDNY